MIEINAITNAQGKLEPERPLTDEERDQVISIWYFDGSFKHYVIGEEDIVAARHAALELVFNDVKSSGNPQWQTNLALLNNMLQTYGDTYLEEYINQVHPAAEIFN